MGQVNPYNYAFDNSIRFIDPDGMRPIDSPVRRGNPLINAALKSIVTGPAQKVNTDTANSFEVSEGVALGIPAIFGGSGPFKTMGFSTEAAGSSFGLNINSKCITLEANLIKGGTVNTTIDGTTKFGVKTATLGSATYSLSSSENKF